MFIILISKEVCVVVISEFEITFNRTIVDFVIIIYMYFYFVNEAVFSQLLSRGQVSLFLQLHKSLGVVDVASTVALCCFIMFEMFFIQQ